MAVVYNSNQSTNGLQIKELTYSNDGHKSDEWELYFADKELTPKHYYDMGFVARHFDISTQYLLEVCQNKSSERFLRIFGLYSSPAYYSFESTSDICKEGQYGTVNFSYVDTVACYHEPFCQAGDTMIADFRSRVGTSWYPSTKLLWTGHRMQGDSPSFFAGRETAILITPLKTPIGLSTDVKILRLSQTLHHEMSHALGADDHYCSGPDPITRKCSVPTCDKCVLGRDTVRDCIMGENITIESPDNVLHCNSCCTNINNFISNNS